jgi:hypothetical protein
MRHVRNTLVILALGLGLALSASGDDTKPPKGTLPPGYNKLALSDKQKSEIFSIAAKYKKQIAALRKQIEQLREKQKTETFNVLTKDQKAKLLGAGKDTKGTTDKPAKDKP